MPVSVARGVLSRIREDPGGIVLQVRGASDPAAAELGLGRAGAEIWELDGGPRSAPGLGPGDRNNPKYVSEVYRTREGPFLMIDGGYTPAGLLRTIPDIIARHLAEAGVGEARIVSPPEGGPLDVLGKLPRAVVLRLFAQPSASLRRPPAVPASWLEEAEAWVSEGLDSDDELWAAVVSVQFPLGLSDVRPFLDGCAETRAGLATLVAGDLKAHIRGANCCFYGLPTLALAGGGPAATDAELLGTMDALIEVARRLAPEVAYAFVSISLTFGGFRAIYPGSEWYRSGGEAPEMVEVLCDEVVLEAFPYQVLGPGHLERLGGAPQGARPLAGGKVELPLFEPEAWLLDESSHEKQLSQRRRDKRVQGAAREVLSPCLFRDREIDPLYRERYVNHSAGRD